MMPTPPPCFLQPLLFSLTSLLPSLYLYSCFLFTNPLSPFFPRLLPSFLRTPSTSSSFPVTPASPYSPSSHPSFFLSSTPPIFRLSFPLLLPPPSPLLLPPLLPPPILPPLFLHSFSPPHLPSSYPLQLNSFLKLSSLSYHPSSSLLPSFSPPPILPSPPSYFIFSSPPLSSPIFEGWGIYMVTTSQKLKNSSPL